MPQDIRSLNKSDLGAQRMNAGGKKSSRSRCVALLLDCVLFGLWAVGGQAALITFDDPPSQSCFSLTQKLTFELLQWTE